MIVTGSEYTGVSEGTVGVSPLTFPLCESESEVAQSCPTPSDPMDCSLPGPFIHGISQARIPEWVAIAFSRIVPSRL